MRPYVPMKVSPVLSSGVRWFGGLDFCFALVHFTPPTAAKNESRNFNYGSHSFFFFFGKMNKPKILISGFFSCDVQFFMWYPILSLIELQCCKIKLESIIQSKNVIFKSCKCWCLLLLLFLNKWRCYNSLSYVGLCKDFFVRVFFSRVFCFYWIGIVW